MTDFPSLPDLFRRARDEVLRRNASLRRAVIERSGTDANALVAAAAVVGDELVGQLIRVTAALYLDTARGAALDRLVFDRYQITRKPAAPARGAVEFTTTAPSSGSFTIPAGTRLSTSDRREFATLADVVFPVGSAGPITAPVQSRLAGLSQQAREGTITSITSAIGGSPADLRVTNLLATAGADDEERDPELRDRARLYYTTAFRATLRALERGALAVPGVRTATAFESLTAEGDPARIAEVVITDAFTLGLVDAAVIPSGYAAQSAVLATQTRAALQNVRAAGIQAIVTVASVSLLGATLSLRFRAGADTIAATRAAKGALVAYTNSLRAGEPFIKADAEARLARVPGLVVMGGELITPAGDVIPSPVQALRTDESLITLGAAA